VIPALVLVQGQSTPRVPTPPTTGRKKKRKKKKIKVSHNDRKMPQTRSGGRYGLRDKVDDDDGDDGQAIARGTTRSGAVLRRVQRGHYPSIAALKKAHHRLFSQEPVFMKAGECFIFRRCQHEAPQELPTVVLQNSRCLVSTRESGRAFCA
jgi:hypothetical protein